MAIPRYDPLNLINQLHREINQLFDPIMGRTASDSVATSDWVPAVDIKEEKERFVIHADLPGMDPKDIEVSMENGVLTLKGERKGETDEERTGYKRMERARGTFYRRFGLPDTADADRISAKGRNGVLEITIPKLEKVQRRKITVEG
jgi:Molecular chaperone (small heat shock protein)